MEQMLLVNDAGFKILQNTKETVVTAQDGGVILLNASDSNGSG